MKTVKGMDDEVLKNLCWFISLQCGDHLHQDQAKNYVDVLKNIYDYLLKRRNMISEYDSVMNQLLQAMFKIADKFIELIP